MRWRRPGETHGADLHLALAWPLAMIVALPGLACVSKLTRTDACLSFLDYHVCWG